MCENWRNIFFLVYYWFHSIQGFLHALGSMCESYWLTYSTRIPCQTRRHLCKQLLTIVCKNFISIMECMWWQRCLEFFCCSFPFCRIFLFKREITRGYLKEIFLPLFFLFFRACFQLNKGRNFNIQDNIFQARKED
jgi:hypothetical protein